MPASNTAAQLDVRKTYKMFVNGAFVRTESGRAYQPGDRAVNVPRGSRKDLREAVVAARNALGGWSSRTAYNRGQILYRIAEMLDARKLEFAKLLGGSAAARREVALAVDCWVWYAGWCDKLAAVAGTVNPVAGPYFTFTVPEPTGVVGAVAPELPALLGVVRQIAPILCGGNTAVAILSETSPLPGLVLGEVLATSDLPGGAVNLLSGYRREMVSWMAGHMDVNAIDLAGCDQNEARKAQEAAAANVKRVVTSRPEQSLEAVTSFLEMKTIWHPIGR